MTTTMNATEDTLTEYEFLAVECAEPLKTSRYYHAKGETMKDAWAYVEDMLLADTKVIVRCLPVTVVRTKA